MFIGIVTNGYSLSEEGKYSESAREAKRAMRGGRLTKLRVRFRKVGKNEINGKKTSPLNVRRSVVVSRQ